MYWKFKNVSSVVFKITHIHIHMVQGQVPNHMKPETKHNIVHVV